MRNYQQKSIAFPVLMIHYRKINLKNKIENRRVERHKYKSVNLVQIIYFITFFK
jgi:hypothetical protein